MGGCISHNRVNKISEINNIKSSKNLKVLQENMDNALIVIKKETGNYTLDLSDSDRSLFYLPSPSLPPLNSVNPLFDKFISFNSNIKIINENILSSHKVDTDNITIYNYKKNKIIKVIPNLSKLITFFCLNDKLRYYFNNYVCVYHIETDFYEEISTKLSFILRDYTFHPSNKNLMLYFDHSTAFFCTFNPELNKARPILTTTYNKERVIIFSLKYQRNCILFISKHVISIINLEDNKEKRKRYNFTDFNNIRISEINEDLIFLSMDNIVYLFDIIFNDIFKYRENSKLFDMPTLDMFAIIENKRTIYIRKKINYIKVFKLIESNEDVIEIEEIPRRYDKYYNLIFGNITKYGFIPINIINIIQKFII